MGLTIEHECPQCGGAIDLDEADRLLQCPYCGVKNFLSPPDYFRFVLPHKAFDQEIIYAPYLRFKGNVFFCREMSIGHRFVDITNVGVKLKGLPLSLGLRPQAMKMRFLSPEIQGSFLRFSLKASDILARATKLSSGGAAGNILHRAYIGETLSLIYLPLFVQSNQLFDAISDQPVTHIQEDQDILGSDRSRDPKWKMTFIPTICPKCGWNLEGETDSVVLICTNCDTAWEEKGGRFREISVFAAPGQDDETVYLPFWRTNGTCNEVQINTFADFVRVTNQPVVSKKTWEGQDMHFWSPAFKIRPKIFLQVSKQMTVSQVHLHSENKIPKKHLKPVTLPRDEATQAMHITLADSAVNKENIFPYLPRIRFEIKDSTLAYLPFSDTGHELVFQDMQISINKQALGFGRQL